MTTCNDLELNELLVQVALLQPVISQLVREGSLNKALTEGSKLEQSVKRLNWRILELMDQRKERK